MVRYCWSVKYDCQCVCVCVFTHMHTGMHAHDAACMGTFKGNPCRISLEKQEGPERRGKKVMCGKVKNCVF